MMKRIEIKTGAVLIGYEFKDLPTEVQEKVVCDHINFEIEVMDEDSPYYDYVLQMERMQTPWFLGETIYKNCKDQIIENLEVNEYLFDEDGEIIPIVTTVGKDNKPVKHEYKNRHECKIIAI